MVLFVIGLIIGMYIGVSMQHEIKIKKTYDVHIECGSEEDMKTVMKQLKGIKECQKD